MTKKIAFIFPGQGAQYPGMGRDFFEKYPSARAVFEEADRLLGDSFSSLIFEGDAIELTQTKNSQLAIFITSLAILRVVEETYPDLKPTYCAGLSLGEYCALVAAQKLSFEEALTVVKARGLFMQEACETHPGTLNVVLGLDLPAVREIVNGIQDLWVANINCPGQIVIAGTHEALEKGALLLKEKGAKRVLPLDVSGAFHSGLMQEAKDKLAEVIDQVEVKASPIDVVMNVPGSVVREPNEIRSNMIQQVTSPTYWQKGIEAMEVDFFIEMGPGKSLAGMNKRIGVSAPTISVEKVEELQGVENAIYAQG